METLCVEPLHCLKGAAEAENNPVATLKSPRNLRAPADLVTVERTPAENRNCRAHCVDLVTVLAPVIVPRCCIAARWVA